MELHALPRLRAQAIPCAARPSACPSDTAQSRHRLCAAPRSRTAGFACAGIARPGIPADEGIEPDGQEKSFIQPGGQEKQSILSSRSPSAARPSGGGAGEQQEQGPSADPLWKDVFPAYLQNRESDQEVSSSGAGAPNPHRLLGAGSADVFMTSAPGRPSSPYQSASPPFSLAKPADISRPKYVREPVPRNDPIWAAIRAEAKLEAEQEPILSSFLYASILAHDCFERSLGFVLANRLKNVTLLATQLMDVFDDVLMRSDIREAIRADVQAVRDRDPSCRSYSSALLYYKGYHALQSYRIAHALWNRGQKILALALQSRISEVFAVDIHPAARIGQGILMDHGTGVVIGETAVVGDRVSMLQGVTLGGTGKEAGDRHPKVQGGVLIGAGATILGNITIGRGSMIAAGSLVLKDVPPHSMVAGTPAKVVGTLKEDTPSLTMKHDITKTYYDSWENERGGRI